MRHSVDGRKFGRNTSHRVAMFRNLANSIIEKEQVITTVQKAKEARRVVDRLITLAKKDSVHARRLAFDRTRDEAVVSKLFSVLSQRYEKRPGGYTRVLKLSERRRGDSAEMAMIELVDHPPIDRKRKPKTEVEGEAKATAEGEGTKQADPFGRFRKIFSGKRGKGDATPKAKSAGKSVARRAKTMAGSSNNKSGGSSGA